MRETWRVNRENERRKGEGEERRGGEEKRGEERRREEKVHTCCVCVFECVLACVRARAHTFKHVTFRSQLLSSALFRSTNSSASGLVEHAPS